MERVYLLHGLGRTGRSLRRLRRHLEGVGFVPVDWSYPSWRRTIGDHGETLRRELAAADDDPTVKRIHLVGHSLGGILIRYALYHGAPAKMGRAVLLAPPNRGSRWAFRLAPFLGGIVKPLGELSDSPASTVNHLGVPDGVPVGIIAAEKDVQVRVADTHMAGATAHLIVPGSHTFIMNRQEVLAAVERFLETGRF